MMPGAKNTTGYVNYVYNISSRGTTEVATQLMGLSGMASNVLGQLAFQTSSYLSSTEGALLTFGVVAATSMTKATQKAMEFDEAMRTVKAIAGDTDISNLGDEAMAMSNKFGIAVTEMTEGLESLARAGITDQNVMSKILEEGMKLSKLEGLDLNTAMDSLISTTNLLDLQGLDSSSPEYGDAVAAQNQRIVSTSEVSPISARDIIRTLEHVGGYAASTKIDQEDLFAVIAQLGAKGTKSDIAGTSLRAFLAAGQKDTAQRALKRIGLDVTDLWKDDETIMSITDMKDLLDEAMEERGYSQQEKLEFYSDFAGYKQANQIMKIDTKSAREFKEDINNAWDLGKKIENILGSAQTNVQSLVQTGINFLTKVGQPLLPIVSTIAFTAKSIINVVDAIPFSNWVIAGGLILGSIKAISVIFNKIAPQLIQFKGEGGGISKMFSSIREDLQESYEILKDINNLDAISERSLNNYYNNITEEDEREFYSEKEGINLRNPEVFSLWKFQNKDNKDKFVEKDVISDWKRKTLEQKLDKEDQEGTKEERNKRSGKKSTAASVRNNIYERLGSIMKSIDDIRDFLLKGDLKDNKKDDDRRNIFINIGKQIGESLASNTLTVSDSDILDNTQKIIDILQNDIIKVEVYNHDDVARREDIDHNRDDLRRRYKYDRSKTTDEGQRLLSKYDNLNVSQANYLRHRFKLSNTSGTKNIFKQLDDQYKLIEALDNLEKHEAMVKRHQAARERRRSSGRTGWDESRERRPIKTLTRNAVRLEGLNQAVRGANITNDNFADISFSRRREYPSFNANRNDTMVRDNRIDDKKVKYQDKYYEDYHKNAKIEYEKFKNSVFSNIKLKLNIDENTAEGQAMQKKMDEIFHSVFSTTLMKGDFKLTGMSHDQLTSSIDNIITEYVDPFVTSKLSMILSQNDSLDGYTNVSNLKPRNATNFYFGSADFRRKIDVLDNEKRLVTERQTSMGASAHEVNPFNVHEIEKGIIPALNKNITKMNKGLKARDRMNNFEIKSGTKGDEIKRIVGNAIKEFGEKATDEQWEFLLSDIEENLIDENDKIEEGPLSKFGIDYNKIQTKDMMRLANFNPIYTKDLKGLSNTKQKSILAKRFGELDELKLDEYNTVFGSKVTTLVEDFGNEDMFKAFDIKSNNDDIDGILLELWEKHKKVTQGIYGEIYSWDENFIDELKSVLKVTEFRDTKIMKHEQGSYYTNTYKTGQPGLQGVDKNSGVMEGILTMGEDSHHGVANHLRKVAQYSIELAIQENMEELMKDGRMTAKDAAKSIDWLRAPKWLNKNHHVLNKEGPKSLVDTIIAGSEILNSDKRVNIAKQTGTAGSPTKFLENMIFSPLLEEEGDEGGLISYFRKEQEELMRWNTRKMISNMMPRYFHSGSMGANTAELRAIPYTFEGKSIKGLFKRLPTHGRDMSNIEVFDKDNNFLGYEPNIKKDQREIHNDALQHMRNKKYFDADVRKTAAAFALQSGWSDEDVRNLEATESQKAEAKRMFETQEFQNISQYKESKGEEAWKALVQEHISKQVQKAGFTNIDDYEQEKGDASFRTLKRIAKEHAKVNVQNNIIENQVAEEIEKFLDEEGFLTKEKYIGEKGEKSWNKLEKSITNKVKKSFKPGYDYVKAYKDRIGEESWQNLRGLMDASNIVRDIQKDKEGNIIGAKTTNMFTRTVSQEEYQDKIKRGVITSDDVLEEFIDKETNEKSYRISDNDMLHIEEGDFLHMIKMRDLIDTQNYKDIYGSMIAATNDLTITDSYDSNIQYPYPTQVNPESLYQYIRQMDDDKDIEDLLMSIGIHDRELLDNLKLYVAEREKIAKSAKRANEKKLESDGMDQLDDSIEKLKRIRSLGIKEHLGSVISEDEINPDLIDEVDDNYDDMRDLLSSEAINNVFNTLDPVEQSDLLLSQSESPVLEIERKLGEHMDEKARLKQARLSSPAVKQIQKKQEELNFINKLSNNILNTTKMTSLDKFSALSKEKSSAQQYMDNMDLLPKVHTTPYQEDIPSKRNTSNDFIISSETSQAFQTIFSGQIFETTKQASQETQRSIYESLGRVDAEKIGLAISDKIMGLFDVIGNKVVQGINVKESQEASNKLSNLSASIGRTTEYITGWKSMLEELGAEFPILNVLLIQVDLVIGAFKKLQLGIEGIKGFIDMGQRLSGGEPVELLGQAIGPNSVIGKLIQGTTGALSTALNRLIPIVATLTPILLAAGGTIFLVKKALDMSFESHKKYLTALQDEQKENRSRVKSLQAATENSKQYAEKNTNAIKQEQRDRRYQLNKTRLDAANMTRKSTAIDISRAQNDTLWGTYGISEGFGKLSGNYKSTAQEYEGTSKNIREIKEASLANPFTTPSMAEASRYYDANQLAFAQLDEYKAELGELYDEESKIVKKTGSVEEARQTPQFERALDKFVEATGITRDHAKQYLDYMQTEHNVDQAKIAMQAQADTISAQTEMQVQAIQFGGNPADVLGLNGVESQQKAMIKAQADIIKNQLSSQLWWKAVWSTITTPLRIIQAPILMIADILGAIWSFITGNWDNATALGGRALSRINVLGEPMAYWSAWGQTESTNFAGIGASNVDETDRADYGNAGKHTNVGRTHGTNLVAQKNQKGGLFGLGPSHKRTGDIFSQHRDVVRDNDRNSFFGQMFDRVITPLNNIFTALLSIGAFIVGGKIVSKIWKDNWTGKVLNLLKQDNKTEIIKNVAKDWISKLPGGEKITGIFGTAKKFIDDHIPEGIKSKAKEKIDNVGKKYIPGWDKLKGVYTGIQERVKGLYQGTDEEESESEESTPEEPKMETDVSSIAETSIGIKEVLDSIKEILLNGTSTRQDAAKQQQQEKVRKQQEEMAGQGFRMIFGDDNETSSSEEESKTSKESKMPAGADEIFEDDTTFNDFDMPMYSVMPGSSRKNIRADSVMNFDKSDYQTTDERIDQNTSRLMKDRMINDVLPTNLLPEDVSGKVNRKGKKVFINSDMINQGSKYQILETLFHETAHKMLNPWERQPGRENEAWEDRSSELEAELVGHNVMQKLGFAIPEDMLKRVEEQKANVLANGGKVNFDLVEQASNEILANKDRIITQLLVGMNKSSLVEDDAYDNMATFLDKNDLFPEGTDIKKIIFGHNGEDYTGFDDFDMPMYSTTPETPKGNIKDNWKEAISGKVPDGVSEAAGNWDKYLWKKGKTLEGGIRGVSDHASGVGGKWMDFLGSGITNVAAQWVGEKNLDDLSKQKRSYINKEDRDFLAEEYGLKDDIKGMRAKPAGKYIRDTLDERGQWDEAMKKLQGRNVEEKGGIFNIAKDHIGEKYVDPWKKYAQDTHAATVEKAKWYRNGIDLDEDEGGASGLTKMYAKVLDIKEKMGLKEDTSIVEMIKDPQKIEDFAKERIKSKAKEKINSYGDDTVVGKYRNKFNRGKELLNDPEQLQEWTQGKLSDFRSRGEENLAAYDKRASTRERLSKTKMPQETIDKLFPEEKLSLAGKVAKFKRDKLGIEEGESLSDILSNPERAIEVGKKGYEAIKEHGVGNTIDDIVGSSEEGTGIFGELKESFGIDLDKDLKDALNIEGDESIKDALKNKLSGIFNKETIEEAVEEGIDEEEGEESFVDKAKQKLSGLFGREEAEEEGERTKIPIEGEDEDWEEIPIKKMGKTFVDAEEVSKEDIPHEKQEDDGFIDIDAEVIDESDPFDEKVKEKTRGMHTKAKEKLSGLYNEGKAKLFNFFSNKGSPDNPIDVNGEVQEEGTIEEEPGIQGGSPPEGEISTKEKMKNFLTKGKDKLAGLLGHSEPIEEDTSTLKEQYEDGTLPGSMYEHEGITTGPLFGTDISTGEEEETGIDPLTKRYGDYKVDTGGDTEKKGKGKLSGVFTKGKDKLTGIFKGKEKCPRCGFELEEGDKYCTNCGWERGTPPVFPEGANSSPTEIMERVKDHGLLFGAKDEAGIRGNTDTMDYINFNGKSIVHGKDSGEQLIHTGFHEMAHILGGHNDTERPGLDAKLNDKGKERSWEERTKEFEADAMSIGAMQELNMDLPKDVLERHERMKKMVNMDEVDHDRISEGQKLLVDNADWLLPTFDTALEKGGQVGYLGKKKYKRGFKKQMKKAGIEPGEVPQEMKFVDTDAEKIIYGDEKFADHAKSPVANMANTELLNTTVPMGNQDKGAMLSGGGEVGDLLDIGEAFLDKQGGIDGAMEKIKSLEGGKDGKTIDTVANIAKSLGGGKGDIGSIVKGFKGFKGKGGKGAAIGTAASIGGNLIMDKINTEHPEVGNAIDTGLSILRESGEGDKIIHTLGGEGIEEMTGIDLSFMKKDSDDSTSSSPLDSGDLLDTGKSMLEKHGGKGGKVMSKVGNVAKGLGGGKGGEIMGKVGNVAKGLGGGKGGGVGKAAGKAAGKVGGKALGKVGGKIAGKVGGKLASKAIAQVGSKVLGGALMATGVGAPLGLLLESPIGGMLIEGAMDLGGKALGAIGGAIGGAGKAVGGFLSDPLGAIGGLFGGGNKVKSGTGKGSGGGGIGGALGALAPLGMAGALAGGALGGLGGLLGGGKGPGGAGGVLGALGAMSPLGMLGGLLGGEEGNQQKMNPLTAVMPGLGLAGMAAGGIMGLLGKNKDEKNAMKAQLSVPNLLEKIFNKNKDSNSKQSGMGDIVGKILKAILKDKDKKDSAPAGDGGGVNIIIHNININTDDDPEKIKTAFMQLMVELKDQVSPRMVSRTVGEKPAAAEDTSANNQQQQNTQDAQNATNQLQNANSAAQQQQNNNK